MSAKRNRIAVFASVVALMVGYARSIQAQNLSFQKLSEIPIGQGFSGPRVVATGDFDADGKLDLVVGDLSESGSAVVVMSGRGDGTFRRGDRIPLAQAVGQIAVVDLDRDGHLDIVAVTGVPTGVAVLLGSGDGTFRLPLLIAVPLTSGALVAADLNSDGIPDLAVGGDRNVLLLLGRGDGTFRDPVAFFAGLPAVMMRSADLNLDGKPDLIVIHPLTGLVSLLISTAGGGFGHRVLPTDGLGYAHDAAIADFNKDGKPDLVVCGEYGYMVFSGNGDGSFQQAQLRRESARPLAVAVTDFNGDETSDLILGNYYDGKITVLLGRGDGTFDEMPNIQAKGDNFSVVVADMNGDGKPDVVAANYSSHSALVALGEGDGQFRRPIIMGTFTRNGTGPASMVAADFDGDGEQDLAVANYMAETVDILNGGFEPNGTYVVGDNPNRVYLDESGRNLIVAGGRTTVSGYSESASLLLGTGGGRFRQVTTAVEKGSIVAAADFDRDGIVDLAVTTWAFTCSPLPLCGPTVMVSSILIVLGKGDGSFERVGEIEGIVNLGGVVADDFNHDGIPDLAVTAEGDRGARVALIFLNRGGGKFQEAGRYSLAGNPACSPILVADFNGDGRPDLAVNCQTSISILLGATDGSFVLAPNVAGSAVSLFTTGDFDGDGHIDLAGVEGPSSPNNETPNDIISVYRGDGYGKFKEPVRVYSILGNIYSLVAADFDRDGRTDLAAMVYSTGQGTISILASRTAP